MRITHSITIASKGLATHKFRSFLTVLGIIIGITSIIVVMSTGKGAQNFILSQVEGLGTKTIVVIPGREPKGPSDAAQIFSDSLKERDLELLGRKSNVPGAELVMPIVFGGQTGVAGRETYRLTIFGASDLMANMFDLRPREGGFFTDDDVKARGRAGV